MIDLDLVIDDANSLPALPKSAARLASLLSDADWEMGDLVDTVRHDPVLSGQVLSVANSAANAGVCEITDVGQAAFRTGPGVLMSLAFGAAARGTMKGATTSSDLDETALWRHSVAAALAVECARGKTAESPPAEAFVGALLHDIGALVLDHHLTEEVMAMLHRSQKEGGNTPLASELEILGTHHAEVGGLVARAWQLPETIAEAITFHHNPAAAPTEEGRALAYVVALGDLVASDLVAHYLNPDAISVALEEVLSVVGMSKEQYDELIEEVRDGLDEVLTRYE